MKKTLAVSFAAMALVAGLASSAYAGEESPRYGNGGDILNCNEIPILPIPILSNYQHNADCSDNVKLVQDNNNKHVHDNNNNKYVRGSHNK
ncbi:hypothetical protein [Streptomyces zagrosensis]|uniref:Chaplin domain-containing protein n=1 Tax=Streptomyces zagrosensis TaxID=1042984 RepID=A0A7W9QBR0_9ACTN|nr:hypothetical protein [Streptomyces zagrosensis]MBB5937316.1 hypothetical protein [Streptomyces zagrosensis]